MMNADSLTQIVKIALAVIIITVMAIILVNLSGCAQQPTHIELHHSVSEIVDGQLVKTTEDRAVIDGLPREWHDLYFKWGIMVLGAGSAAMLHDPWADVTQELGTNLIREAVCVQNPLLAQCIGR